MRVVSDVEVRRRIRLIRKNQNISLSKLSAKYGLDDRTLMRTCRKYGIDHPSVAAGDNLIAKIKERQVSVTSTTSNQLINKFMLMPW